MALVFLGAGLSKLRHGGIAWVLSDTMQTFLIRSHYNASDADPLVGWGLTLSGWPWAPRTLGAVALLTELLFPIALLSRTARWVLVPASFAMLVGIRALMGPTFGGFLVAYAFWPSWTSIGHRLRAWLALRRDVTVLFDGDCGVCGATVAVMRRLDLLGRLEFIDITRDWGTIGSRGARLDRLACYEEMHIITTAGSVLRGFAAYRWISRVLPIGWVVLPILHLPGVAGIGQLAYRRIAARRHHGPCPVPGRS
jgi:predicted DCC family thiol-disulfide oxidoreductase YuxK